MSFTLGIVSPVDALQGPGVFLYLKVYYVYDCQMILLHCRLKPEDLSGSQTHGPLFMEETDVIQDDEYGGDAEHEHNVKVKSKMKHEHNVKVKSKIIEEISEGKENHYALGLVESK